MKREGWIAAGVLVPFCLLVAAGLHFSEQRHEPPSPTPGATTVVVNARVQAPPPAAHDAGPKEEADAGSPAPAPSSFLATVTPQVRQCLTDQSPRGYSELLVRVLPLPDGGLDIRPQTQDPYLSACVHDVLEEAAEGPTEPLEHLFTSEP